MAFMRSGVRSPSAPPSTFTRSVREVRKTMRPAGLKKLLLVAVALVMAGAFPACDNPFDPLNTSDKIQGLAYFDFSATQEHWDSDPEWDGLQITMSYFNEFGDQLNFHDKPHKIEIEIYTEDTTGLTPVRGDFLTTKTIEYSNSDDLINIPIEFYGGALPLPSEAAISGCLLVRIFPPEA